MKKIVSMIAVMLIVAAGSVYAGDFTSAAGGDVKAGASGSEKSIAKLSTGVSADIKYDNTTYAATTKHLNGPKEYGSSAGDTRLYSKENATLEAPSASDSSAFASGWTSL